MTVRAHDVQERAVPPPLAVLAGRGPLEWLGAAHGWLWLAVPALIYFALHVAVVLALPAPRGGGGVLGSAAWVLLTSVGVGAAALAAAWGLRHHAGRAELFADRVIARGADGHVHVAFFDDLDTFDDGSVDFVRLVRHASPVAVHLDVSVPTSTEQVRVAILAALAGAGVPRHEDAVPRSGRARAPRGPAVVVAAEVGAALGPRRPGTVTLDQRGVRLLHDEAVLTQALVHGRLDLALAWDDVVGWRSVADDVLCLVLRPGLLRSVLMSSPSVRTALAADRARLERDLEAHGVPLVAS